MPNKSFSAAEVRLLAHISQGTLERYVREFADYYFSPGAQAHKRGRRFDERDLKQILLIKRMHFARNSHSQIVASLTGENSDAGSEWLELDDIARTAAEALQTQRKNESRLIRIEQELFNLKRARDLKEYLGQLNHKINGLASVVNQLIDINNDHGQGIKTEQATESSTAKPGFWDRLLSHF